MNKNIYIYTAKITLLPHAGDTVSNTPLTTTIFTHTHTHTHIYNKMSRVESICDMVIYFYVFFESALLLCKSLSKLGLLHGSIEGKKRDGTNKKSDIR